MLHPMRTAARRGKGAPGARLALLLSLAGVGACKSRGDDVDALRALGYVEVAEDAGEGRVGLLTWDRERAAPGLTYFTSVGDCSSHVVALDGTILRSWQHQPCHHWGNTVLTPSGSVLAIHSDPPEVPTPQGTREARALLELGPGGSLVRELRLPVHHDIDFTPSGQLVTLTYRHRALAAVHKRIAVRDDSLALLAPDGALAEEASLSDMLLASSVLRLRKVRPRQEDWMLEVDVVHANAVQWMQDAELAARDPLYSLDNLLVCLRNQDALAIVSWPRREILWSWGREELSGPHDASLLANGNLLVFDNGLARKWSRVVEVEPQSGRIVWQYHATPKESMFTRTRGAAQRLANGNTLVTYSSSGLIFEVTPAGETVWSFRNPRRSADGLPLAVTRARRYTPRASPAGQELQWLPAERMD